MKIKKLSFFDRLILRILGFDPQKISKWISKKNVLSPKRNEEICKEWQKIVEEERDLKINIKNIKQSRKKLKNLLKRVKTLKKERRKGHIEFDSFSEFRKFSLWLEIFIIKTLRPFKVIKHEKEHAKIYWNHNIQCRFGWNKLFDEKRGYSFVPFVIAEASEKIHIASLKNVKYPSHRDKLDLELESS